MYAEHTSRVHYLYHTVSNLPEVRVYISWQNCPTVIGKFSIGFVFKVLPRVFFLYEGSVIASNAIFFLENAGSYFL